MFDNLWLDVLAGSAFIFVGSAAVMVIGVL